MFDQVKYIARAVTRHAFSVYIKNLSAVSWVWWSTRYLITIIWHNYPIVTSPVLAKSSLTFHPWPWPSYDPWHDPVGVLWWIDFDELWSCTVNMGKINGKFPRFVPLLCRNNAATLSSRFVVGVLVGCCGCCVAGQDPPTVTWGHPLFRHPQFIIIIIILFVQ